MRIGVPESPKTNDYLATPLLFSEVMNSSVLAKICRAWRNLSSTRGEMEDEEAAHLRRCRLNWFGHETGVGKLFHLAVDPYIDSINHYFDFNVSTFAEQLQLTRYDKGDYLDWHLDIAAGVPSMRKISISMQLSRDDQYDGGELEFFPGGKLQDSRDAGSLIVFPSYLAHRITPVTRGRRFSLVTWLHGEPFR